MITNALPRPLFSLSQEDVDPTCWKTHTHTYSIHEPLLAGFRVVAIFLKMSMCMSQQ